MTPPSGQSYNIYLHIKASLMIVGWIVAGFVFSENTSVYLIKICTVGSCGDFRLYTVILVVFATAETNVTDA